MSTSPTARTKAYYKERGIPIDDAERRITKRLTKDLFGFIDLVALDEGGIIGIQVTNCPGGNFAAHRRKILVECRSDAIAWIEAGGRIQLIGWNPIKVDPRIEEITLDQLQAIKEQK